VLLPPQVLRRQVPPAPRQVRLARQQVRQAARRQVPLAPRQVRRELRQVRLACRQPGRAGVAR
jgi:hypothetical protein